MTIPSPDMQSRIEVLTEFAAEAAERGEHMFYVRIPASVEPLERGELFEDPLQEALAHAALGEVTGGGSQLAQDNSVAYCGIDVVVNDRSRGLELIRRTLKQLQVPVGTVIEEFTPVWQELPL